jgi:hypothetical protein
MTDAQMEAKNTTDSKFFTNGVASRSSRKGLPDDPFETLPRCPAEYSLMVT